eukprot:TRINITY_DN93004_c0_g1_i1.p1 TRINITY_DN93004_c0_g1~~TRINITY_DN93004_c0_g1_i1.p1  ORF type:complete len:266 (+),score=84.72 TRINITY_DN93004_c0_g1_i1:80-877(+)
MFCCRRRASVDVPLLKGSTSAAGGENGAKAAGTSKASAEGRICPITGLVGHCPMAKKAPVKEGDKPPELKVLMFLLWEEGESKVSVGVYPHNSPHWEALDLPDTSTKEEIKAQYRKLSVKYHPDKNKEAGAKERFQKIQEAYEALKDVDGNLAFPWDRHPENRKIMPGTDLISTLGFLGAEAAQSDPIKAQFMQQVVKEATECKVLMFDREKVEKEKTTKETWADALCVDEKSGANHLVKVYRKIVTFSEEVLREAAADMEEIDD